MRTWHPRARTRSRIDPARVRGFVARVLPGHISTPEVDIMQIDFSQERTAPPTLAEACAPVVAAFDAAPSDMGDIEKGCIVFQGRPSSPPVTIACLRTIAEAARRAARVTFTPELKQPAPAPDATEAMRRTLSSSLAAHSTEIRSVVGEVASAMRLLGASPVVHEALVSMADLKARGLCVDKIKNVLISARDEDWRYLDKRSRLIEAAAMILVSIERSDARNVPQAETI